MNDTVKDVALLKRKLERLETVEIPFAPILAPFQSIPGLVGLWGMNNVDVSSGDLYDSSGQGRRMTYNGNPTYNIYDNRIAYLDLDGTGDYLSLADAADLDITGLETHNAAALRGLTMGGWFWVDTAGTDGLIGKWDSVGNQRSYLILDVTTVFRFAVSSNGTLEISVDSATRSTGAWYFIIGRFDPSTELSLLVNGVETVNTTSIPASIFASTAAFEIGRRTTAGTELDGRVGPTFLSANYLPDAWCTYLFESSRGYFGV